MGYAAIDRIRAAAVGGDGVRSASRPVDDADEVVANALDGGAAPASAAADATGADHAAAIATASATAAVVAGRPAGATAAADSTSGRAAIVFAAHQGIAAILEAGPGSRGSHAVDPEQRVAGRITGLASRSA